MKNLIRKDARRRTAVAATLGIAACALSAVALSQDDEGPLDGTRAALEKWVETRRAIAAEKRDWALGRDLLQDRIRLVQQEIESLQGRTAQAGESVAEADRKRSELTEENDALSAASERFEATVKALEARTKALIPLLPEAARERVEPFSQKLPSDPESTSLSIGERYMFLIGTLNELNKFQREVHVGSGVRTLADGKTAEVSTLHFGLGQSYYVTTKGDAAGVGTRGEEAWEWQRADEDAEAIAEAIAIHRSESRARFVRLPVRID